MLLINTILGTVACVYFSTLQLLLELDIFWDTIVSKLKTRLNSFFVNEFYSHWVPHTSGFVIIKPNKWL